MLIVQMIPKWYRLVQLSTGTDTIQPLDIQQHNLTPPSAMSLQCRQSAVIANSYGDSSHQGRILAAIGHAVMASKGARD